ncbi:hypothetical protein N24_3197 [Corynebacterium suranareeae]|uniref:Uncharacterized protein n=1 Tax=Corynebacterium suranareeae TaxID=2506452 RepID=A0A169SDQ4_9CORY|nr:hypothetical protein N24_3197 [Corynebacterium suranareeae]
MLSTGGTFHRLLMLCVIFIVTRSSIPMSNPCGILRNVSSPEGGVEKRLDGRYAL